MAWKGLKALKRRTGASTLILGGEGRSLGRCQKRCRGYSGQSLEVLGLGCHRLVGYTKSNDPGFRDQRLSPDRLFPL